MPVVDQFYDVPTLAKLLAVKDTKILTWIKTGELKAGTVGTARSCRPRWRIRKEDFETFWAGRLAIPSNKPQGTRTKKPTAKPTRQWIT